MKTEIEVIFSNNMVYCNGTGWEVRVDPRGYVGQGRTRAGAVKDLLKQYRSDLDALKAQPARDFSHYEECVNCCREWLRQNQPARKKLPTVVACPDCGRMVAARFPMHFCEGIA